MSNNSTQKIIEKNIQSLQQVPEGVFPDIYHSSIQTFTIQ